MSEEKAIEHTSTSQHQPHSSALPILALVFALLMPPIGLVLSIVGLTQFKKGDEHHGMVMAGTIISGIFTFLWLAFIVFYILVIGVVFKSFLGPDGFVQQSIKENQQHQQLQANSAKDTSHDFMNFIQQKDYQSAYLMLSKDVKSEIGDVAAFQKSFAGKDIKSFRLDDPQKTTKTTSYSSASSSGSYTYSSSNPSTASNTYSVTGTAIYTDGKSGTISLNLIDTSNDLHSANFVIDSYRITKD